MSLSFPPCGGRCPTTFASLSAGSGRTDEGNIFTCSQVGGYLLLRNIIMISFKLHYFLCISHFPPAGQVPFIIGMQALPESAAGEYASLPSAACVVAAGV